MLLLLLSWAVYLTRIIFLEGAFTDGESCTEIIPWVLDPLIEEQGSWNDDSCAVNKPFICQAFKRSSAVLITVMGTLTANGGEVRGL